jgi:hypothetical protein
VGLFLIAVLIAPQLHKCVGTNQQRYGQVSDVLVTQAQEISEEGVYRPVIEQGEMDNQN